MYEYSFPTPPAIDGLPTMTEDEARDLARSFFDFEGIDIVTLDLELHFRFLSVFHYTGTDKATGSPISGWLNGGHLPHLLLDDTEIKNPLESLAIYAICEYDWLVKRGVQSEDGSVPPYRLPPDWSLLTYGPELLQVSMGGLTNYIAWHLIKKNQDCVFHPDIREKCMIQGWIDRQPKTST